MLIMLDKRQRQVIAMSNSVNLQHQSEVFRSLNVEGGSKTPYTDATQLKYCLPTIPQLLSVEPQTPCILR